MVSKGVRSILSRKTREDVIFIPEELLNPPCCHTSSIFPHPQEQETLRTKSFLSLGHGPSYCSWRGVSLGIHLPCTMPRASVTKLKFSRASSHGAPWLQVLDSKGNRRSISSTFFPHNCVEPWKYTTTRQSPCQANKARVTP